MSASLKFPLLGPELGIWPQCRVTYQGFEGDSVLPMPIMSSTLCYYVVPRLTASAFGRCSLLKNPSCNATSNKSFCSHEAGAPVVELLDEIQERISSRLKESPSLRPVISKKLQEISEKLDDGVTDALADPSSLTAAERIKQGFLKFKHGTFLKKPKFFKHLADGQNPKFMVIACSDSRVCPTAILGFQPGEAFVVRNIANMVPPCCEAGYPGTSAALEFAVLQLKVENILVMGHSRCGGIRALMSQTEDGRQWSEFIQSWIEIGQPARDLTMAAAAEQHVEYQCTHCEKESINVSLRNLLTFPWIEDAVASGKLALHGGYYNFVEGSFEYWTFDSDGKTSEVSEF